MDGEDVVLSRHALKRMRERLGLPSRACKRELERVMRTGLRREALAPGLREYVAQLEDDRKTCLVSDDGIYVLARRVIGEGLVVVTVLNVPQPLTRAARTSWKKASLK